MDSNAVILSKAAGSMRYETPWQRLPWTGSLSLLVGGATLWVLSLAVLKPSILPDRLLPIDARLLELPASPKNSPPVVQPTPKPSTQIRQGSKPVTKAVTKLATKPVPQSVPASEQIADSAASAEKSDSAAEAASASSPLSAGNPQLDGSSAGRAVYGLTPGAGSAPIGHRANAVIAKPAGIVPKPMPLSVYNEENPFDTGLGEGAAPGGWAQESTSCPGDLNGWERTCGGMIFSQPPKPWCFDANPMYPWEMGSCKEKLDRAIAAYKKRDFAEALAQFNALADKDYGPAQANLGTLYAEGAGVPQDDGQAVVWWKKAARNGDVKAMYNLAQMYSEGKGIAKDDKQAFHWYQKAAYYGYIEAQYNLGVMYALGIGVAEDDKQAAFWYLRAAERGSGNAQYNLGAMYAEGAGVQKDEKQAVYWYCKAAVRGYEKAKSGLLQIVPLGSKTDDEIIYFCWISSDSRRSHMTAYADRDKYTRKLTAEQRADVENAASEWRSKR